jgi:hypothetical protein
MAAVFALEHFASSRALVRLPLCARQMPVRRIHVERLSLGGAVASGGGISHMAHADVALELLHVVLLEHVAHQALPLRTNSSPSATVAMPAASCPRCCSTVRRHKSAD